MLFSAAAGLCGSHLSPQSKLSTFSQTCEDLLQTHHGNPTSAGDGINAHCPKLPPAWRRGTPPAPYTCSRGQTAAWRGAGSACKKPGLPRQALSAFLSVYSSNSATSPTKSAQRLQRTERVCCPPGTDNAFPFDPWCRKAALGPLGNGVRGAGCAGGEHSPSRAKALRSPALLLRVFLPKFPADPAIWLDWQNESGKTARLELGPVVQLHVTFTRAPNDIFKVAEIAHLHFGIPGETIAFTAGRTPAPPWG